jgi:hypothetical protein
LKCTKVGIASAEEAGSMKRQNPFIRELNIFCTFASLKIDYLA